MVKRMALSISRRKVLGILASLLATFVIANLVSLHFQHNHMAASIHVSVSMAIGTDEPPAIGAKVVFGESRKD